MDAEAFSTLESENLPSETGNSSFHKDGLNLLSEPLTTDNITGINTTSDNVPKLMAMASCSAHLLGSEFVKTQNHESQIQDICEESESDLQSVLNKISESLKTINEETMITSEERSVKTSSEEIQFKKQIEEFEHEEKKNIEENKMEIEENISFMKVHNEAVNLEEENKRVAVEMGLELQENASEISLDKFTEHKDMDAEHQTIFENVDKIKEDIVLGSPEVENITTNQNEEKDITVEVCAQENAKISETLDINKLDTTSIQLNDPIEEKMVDKNEVSLHKSDSTDQTVLITNTTNNLNSENADKYPSLESVHDPNEKAKCSKIESEKLNDTILETPDISSTSMEVESDSSTKEVAIEVKKPDIELEAISIDVDNAECVDNEQKSCSEDENVLLLEDTSDIKNNDKVTLIDKLRLEEKLETKTVCDVEKKVEDVLLAQNANISSTDNKVEAEYCSDLRKTVDSKTETSDINLLDSEAENLLEPINDKTTCAAEKSEVPDLEKRVELTSQENPNGSEELVEGLKDEITIIELDDDNDSNDTTPKCVKDDAAVVDTLMVESVEAETQNILDSTRDKKNELFQNSSTDATQTTSAVLVDSNPMDVDKIDQIKDDESSEGSDLEKRVVSKSQENSNCPEKLVEDLKDEITVIELDDDNDSNDTTPKCVKDTAAVVDILLLESDETAKELKENIFDSAGDKKSELLQSSSTETKEITSVVLGDNSAMDVKDDENSSTERNEKTSVIDKIKDDENILTETTGKTNIVLGNNNAIDKIDQIKGDEKSSTETTEKPGIVLGDNNAMDVDKIDQMKDEENSSTETTEKTGIVLGDNSALDVDKIDLIKDDENSEVSDLDRGVVSKPQENPNCTEKLVEDLKDEITVIDLDDDNDSNDTKPKGDKDNKNELPQNSSTETKEITSVVLGDNSAMDVNKIDKIKDDENSSTETNEKTTVIDKIKDDQNSPTETAEKTNIVLGNNNAMDVDKIDQIKDDEKPKGSQTDPLIKLKVMDQTQSNVKDGIVDKDEFYNKECINCECKRACKLSFIAPIFVLNYYKVAIKLNRPQYVCDDCYEFVVNKYDEWCNIMESQQPLLMSNIPQKTNEFVEILDSSDEDDESSKNSESIDGDFGKDTIDLIENELQNAITNVMDRVGIQSQLTWSKTLLQHRLLKLKEDYDWINDTLSSLQKNADRMNNSLYQCPKIEMKVLAPLDLNSGKTYILGESTQANQYTIPPIGEIQRPTIVINGEYYAAKNKVIASWLPSKVVEIVEPPTNVQQKNMRYYKVKFLKIKVPTFKSVPAKHLAYCDMPKVQLSIGTRVIALFDASTLYRGKDTRIIDVRSAFYPGVIAEALQPYNNYRYLIFFDDGYTQYVHHRDVRLICEASVNVWEDIHPGSRDFIQNYLINYKKNRPMVQVKKGQSMITELNGKWIYAKVVDVDASLIQMQFEGQKNHTEWIYRGSTRLGPLFKAIQKTTLPSVTRPPRRSEPFVRYMEDDDSSKQQNETSIPAPQVRSVAKKSITAKPDSQEQTSIVKHLNNSTIFVDDEEPKGTLIYYSSKSENNPPPKTFKPHTCGPSCISREHFEGHYGVLSKPLLNSWERAIFKIKNKKTCIVYRAPCGRSLRNISEVHRYLRMTKNELNVENFVFDVEVGCLNEYQVKKCIVNKTDITEGREKIPIQCVNYYDHTMPPDCDYSADRIPTEGVKLNTDTDFLVGCDCDGDCSEKSNCSCWQLTLEGARYGNPHTPIDNVGYHYKRLLEPVTTGIYECNARCKCSSKCINRVVQHSLETKLQVFKTSNRGWGLRCINDVPKGAFICIYAGNLLTEQKANACGDGDEYFAELDYIEVAERLKEGYESDVQEEVDSDEYVPENDSDEEFHPTKSDKNAWINTRNRTATAKRSNSNTTNGTTEEDDEQERQTINFVPNTQFNDDDITTKYRSMRRLFGKNEFCYVMDAKSIGNVGRYFNHSCSPNLFVQNVFVDTHDLRFPWVAFFALSNIRAGTELTWNYNYEVGVVPGKVLFCQCGAANCRGRLL